MPEGEVYEIERIGTIEDIVETETKEDMKDIVTTETKEDVKDIVMTETKIDIEAGLGKEDEEDQIRQGFPIQVLNERKNNSKGNVYSCICLDKDKLK